MNKDVFNIENFNIIQDNENYYFFRALNMSDNKDIEDKITIEENKGIIKQTSDKKFSDGTNMNMYWSNNYKKIEELAENGNEDAQVIINYATSINKRKKLKMLKT